MIADCRLPIADCRRGGQAMVEFLVGLVALVALFAGLLQVAALTRARTGVMVAARREAGERALMDSEPGATVGGTPDYIRDWDVGPDGRRHSRDDRSTPGREAVFSRLVVDRAAADPSAWAVLDGVPDNRISLLHGTTRPVADFGLVRGRERTRVPLMSAVQRLLYAAPAIDVAANVWMTWMKGLY